MLLLIEFGLSAADLDKFEAFESAVLPRLGDYGAELVLRVRSRDGDREVHLISFPNQASIDRFRSDPVRQSVLHVWDRCGATQSVTEVMALAPQSVK